jgi:hypothetical protein
MQSEQQNADLQDALDFSWNNTKTFWIVMIVAGVVLLLHLLYKIDQNAHYKRQIRRAESFQLGRRMSSGQERQECGLQRPLRAVTRRKSSSSNVSVLPRYERFNEDEVCGQDVQIEKRGRYTYALGERWPVWRG